MPKHRVMIGLVVCRRKQRQAVSALHAASALMRCPVGVNRSHAKYSFLSFRHSNSAQTTSCMLSGATRREGWWGALAP